MIRRFKCTSDEYGFNLTVTFMKGGIVQKGVLSLGNIIMFYPHDHDYCHRRYLRDVMVPSSSSSSFATASP